MPEDAIPPLRSTGGCVDYIYRRRTRRIWSRSCEPSRIRGFWSIRRCQILGRSCVWHGEETHSGCSRSGSRGINQPPRRVARSAALLALSYLDTVPLVRPYPVRVFVGSYIKVPTQNRVRLRASIHVRAAAGRPRVSVGVSGLPRYSNEQPHGQSGAGSRRLPSAPCGNHWCLPISADLPSGGLWVAVAGFPMLARDRKRRRQLRQDLNLLYLGNVRRRKRI
jgi:hypothetical protein